MKIFQLFIIVTMADLLRISSASASFCTLWQIFLIDKTSQSSAVQVKAGCYSDHIQMKQLCARKHMGLC